MQHLLHVLVFVLVLAGDDLLDGLETSRHQLQCWRRSLSGGRNGQRWLSWPMLLPVSLLPSGRFQLLASTTVVVVSCHLNFLVKAVKPAAMYGLHPSKNSFQHAFRQTKHLLLF
jgi:hypothetical protein